MGLTRVTGNIIGLGVSVSGIITATDFIKADGSPVGGGGLGTAITGSNSIYYVDNVLGIGATLTVTVPDTTGNNIAYTQYPEISVNGDADLIISDGDDLLLDVLGIGTDSVVSTTSSTGDLIGNLTGNVTGNLTGNVTGNVTGNLTGTASTATAAATAYGLSGSPTLSGITSISTNNLTVNGNAYPSTGPLSNRNLIINGSMLFDQRNAGSSFTMTGDGQYSLDRWITRTYGGTGRFSVQQDGSSPNSINPSAKLTVTTTDTPGTYGYAFSQRVEGYNFSQLSYGSSSAKTAIISFWVRSSITGTYCFSVRNYNGSRSYVAEYAISTANTWEYKTITVPGDTGGTWLTTNGIGALLEWSLGSQTAKETTAGSWQSGNYVGTSNQTDWIATNGATFYISTVQLEVGTVATPFEHRSYGDELARCQRYYKQVLALQGFTSQSFFTSHYGTTNAVNIIESGLSNMRSGVNVSLGPTGNTGNVQYYSYSGSWTSTTLSVTTLGTHPHQQIYLYANTDGDGRGKLLRRSGASDPNIYVAINAEL